MKSVETPTPEERRELGRARRKAVPRGSHAEWTPAADRADPVALLEAQNATRVPSLVPIRHGRMSVSSFTFYRGTAKIMAADLAGTPDSGLAVQACGDAHLSNFGVFASPERRLVFDCNDFDETLPGPWEWDVKRLAASFTIAARTNDFATRDVDAVTTRSVKAYRDAMAVAAESRVIDNWYAHLPFERIAEMADTAQRERKLEKFGKKARRRNHLKVLDQLAEVVDGEYRFRNDPPLLVRMTDSHEDDPRALEETVEESLEDYRETVSADLRVLLDSYRPVDLAQKVVGVGSVGTRCMVLLLIGRDDKDPLFLQVKQAESSVLEAHVSPSEYANHGQRVVEGQRLMQATGDIFLGWTEARVGPHFYWRQLKDMKGSADLDGADPQMLGRYADLCGWTLARAHSKSGDPIAIAGYLGSGDRFDRAVGEFSRRYVDQAEQDYRAFGDAIESGRIEATPDL